MEAKEKATMEESVKHITDAELDKMAKVFGEQMKHSPKRTIKIPKMEGAEPVVPVIINGYQWRINRGERVEVPEIVAQVLENSGII